MMPEIEPRSNTAEQILDIAQRLIQTRGYSAFSYQDISDVLGIRKASIHYHFPSKTDLGVAVIQRYGDRFAKALDEIAADPAASSLTMLDYYISPYFQNASTDDRVCLCGALAGEMMALPEEMRVAVDHIFVSHQLWLADILKRGVDRGEFRLTTSPDKASRLIFGALQGALLVKRTTGDETQFRDVVTGLKLYLGVMAEA
jgi:TetR/AcrR family transcriptional regulator, transcriptional repressor for nem operon